MRGRTARTIVTALFAAVVFGGSAGGPSVLASPTGETAHGHRATLTFTKWITVNPGAPYMQGIVTGDGIVNAPGPFNFAGQVLIYNQSGIIPNLGPSVPVNNRGQLGDVTQLAAVYEVQSGDHSFRALVQGGDDNTTKHALLDGVVLGGWLAGETVHVQFRDIQCSPVRPEAAGNTCFQGTIAITPGPDR